MIIPSEQTIDFISDLHLQASEPKTFALWKHYMQSTPANTLFILGDLFEVWVGDDAAIAGSFETQCAELIAQTAKRMQIYFMHGNRDFLVNSGLADQANFTLLDDPTVLEFSGQRFLLSHGDELCLADVDYQQFRKLVRSQEWQQDFLAKPLQERQSIAKALRVQSQARKVSYVDVDEAAACQWLQMAKANTLVHGHTHRPADHDMGPGFARVVLSDWDAPAGRAQALRLSAAGLHRLPVGWVSAA